MRLSLNVSPTQPSFANEAQPRTESSLSRIQTILHAAKQCIQNVAIKVSDVCLRKPRSNSDSPLRQCSPISSDTLPKATVPLSKASNYEVMRENDHQLFSVIVDSKAGIQHRQVKDERMPKLAPGLDVVRVAVRDRNDNRQLVSAVHVKALPSSEASLKEKLSFMQSLNSLVSSGVLSTSSSLGEGCMALIEKDKGTLRGYMKTLDALNALQPKFEAKTAEEKAKPSFDNTLKRVLSIAINNSHLVDSMPIAERVELLKLMSKELSAKSKTAVESKEIPVTDMASAKKVSKKLEKQTNNHMNTQRWVNAHKLDARLLKVSEEGQNTATDSSVTQSLANNANPLKTSEATELKPTNATSQNILKAQDKPQTTMSKSQGTPEISSPTKAQTNNYSMYTSYSQLFSVLAKSSCVEGYTQLKDDRVPKLAPGIEAVRVPVRNADGGSQFISAIHIKALPSKQASLDEKIRFMQSLSALLNSGALNGCSSKGHGCMVLSAVDLGTVRGYFRTLEAAHALCPRFDKMTDKERTDPVVDVSLSKTLAFDRANSNIIDSIPLDERVAQLKILIDALSSKDKLAEGSVKFEHIGVSSKAQSNILTNNPQTFDLNEFEQMIGLTQAEINSFDAQGTQEQNSNIKISNFETPFKYLNQHPLYKPSEKFIESAIHNGVAYKAIKSSVRLSKEELTLPKATQTQLENGKYQKIILAYNSLSTSQQNNYLRLVMLDNSAGVNPHKPEANARVYLEKFGDINKATKQKLGEINPFSKSQRSPINLSQMTQLTEDWDFFGDEESDDGIKNSFMFSEVKKRLYDHNKKASLPGNFTNSVPADWSIRFNGLEPEYTAHIIKKLETLISSFEFSADRTITDVMQYQDKNQQNLLHTAVREGYDHIVIGALISLGVSTTTKDSNGDTPLHLAARQNHWAATLVFNSPSNYSATNDDGDTPIHLAARNDDLSTLRRMQCKNIGNILQLTNKQGETVQNIVEQKFGSIPEFKRAEPQQAR